MGNGHNGFLLGLAGLLVLYVRLHRIVRWSVLLFWFVLTGGVNGHFLIVHEGSVWHLMQTGLSKQPIGFALHLSHNFLSLVIFRCHIVLGMDYAIARIVLITFMSKF